MLYYQRNTLALGKQFRVLDTEILRTKGFNEAKDQQTTYTIMASTREELINYLRDNFFKRRRYGNLDFCKRNIRYGLSA